ncbi:MAG: PEP-CTERM sorting domain-containing protein [Rhodocyclaceae bacterium]
MLGNSAIYPLGYNYSELEGSAGGAVSLLSSSFAITTAVPESSGLAMLLAGFGLLGLMARRRLH